MSKTKAKKANKQEPPPDSESFFTLDQASHLTLMPGPNAAATLSEYGNAYGETCAITLARRLNGDMAALETNDLSRCEEMLFAQAHSLQAIFTNLARRSNKQQYLNIMEAYMRLALKAQNQCRMTLETLATIKNPPVVYARQANIAHGHQQVNNGPTAAMRAQENQTTPNELLEAQHGERVDTGTKAETGTSDQTMAAVEPVDRSTNRRRKKPG